MEDAELVAKVPSPESHVKVADKGELPNDAKTSHGNGEVEIDTKLPTEGTSKLPNKEEDSVSVISGHDEFHPVDNSTSTPENIDNVAATGNQSTLVEDSKDGDGQDISVRLEYLDGCTVSGTDGHVDGEDESSACSSALTDTLTDDSRRQSTELAEPQTKGVDDASRGSETLDTPKDPKQDDEKQAVIDTTAPFESVKEAVSKFGGIVDWKAHKIQTVERRKFVEQELETLEEEIPEYRKQSKAAEEAKVQVLKELDSTKRLIEELKLNLERAQTEAHQARQDTELAQLRVEEMEQGIADESSVAAKAQLEVAKARHMAAVTELQDVKEELEALCKDYASLVTEKDIALRKAEEAVATSKDIEKTVEDLTIELIAAKESLESIHASHLEAEEQKIGAVIAKEQDSLSWERELKEAEEELQRLNQKILAAKDLKSKLDTASSLLLDLKAELTAYKDSKLKEEGNQEENSRGDEEVPEKKSHSGIRESVALAKKDLKEVKMRMERATDEVNCLKVAAASLQSELDKEKTVLAAIREREERAPVAVASIEAELNNTKSEIALAQMKEKDAGENMIELPKKLQQAALEADQANSLAVAAREELRKAKEDAEQAKAVACTMESRLHAAQKEIEAAKASEKLAIAAIKALQDSEVRGINAEDSLPAVTLSLEEYYELSKRAHQAEEQANTRVLAANTQIEAAKESERRILEKLEEVKQEMATRREDLKVAMDKAEKAKENKLGAEQELRNWRAEHDQQLKGDKPDQGAAKPKTPRNNCVGEKDSKNINQSPDGAAPVNYASSPSNTETDSSTESKSVKKKKSFFPRFFMFLGRRKSHSSK